MRKNILLFSILTLLVILFSTNTYSQSLEFVHKDTLVEGIPGDFIYSHLEVKNISSSAVNIRINLKTLEKFEGHSILMCDPYLCIPVEDPDYTTENSIPLEINETTGELVYVYVYADEREGTTRLLTRFFNVDDPEDYIEYTATLISTNGSSVNDLYMLKMLSYPAPNPADGYVSFDYNLPESSKRAQLGIYDVNGNAMVTKDLDKSVASISIDTRNLAQGTYYYSLVIDGKRYPAGQIVIAR